MFDFFSCSSCPGKGTRKEDEADVPAELVVDVPHVVHTGSLNGFHTGQREKGLSRRKWRTMGRSSSLRFIPGNVELSQRLPLEKTPQEEEMVRQCLRSNSCFADFSQTQIDLMVKVAWKEVLPEGWIIMSEGSLHNRVFYIVNSGLFEVSAHEAFEVFTVNENFYLRRPKSAKITQDLQTDKSAERSRSRTVHRLGPRTTLGVHSMISGSPRWAKVVALQPSELWVISESDFHIVRMQASDVRPMLGFPEDKELICTAMSNNPNLQAMAPLAHEHVTQLFSLVRKVPAEQGTIFFKEGDLRANAFYILSQGSMEISSSKPFEVVQHNGTSYVSAKTSQSDQPVSQAVHRVGRGALIGESSMLQCAPRVVTVKALDKCLLWAIDRSSFQTVQMKAAEDDMKNRIKYLDRLQILGSFKAEEKQKVAGVMERMRLTKGEVLKRQGEVCTVFYILLEGSVSSSASGNKISKFEADSRSGVVHFFGEQALEGKGQRSSETVQVTSDNAITLMLDYESLMKVWDRLLSTETFPVFQRNATSMLRKNSTLEQMALCNLTKRGLLGHVEFLGTVELCTHNYTKEVYALKTLSKGLITQKGFRKGLMRERNLWIQLIHPNIIRLVATFNEPQNVHFLLEAGTGGELSSVYENKGLFGNAEHAKFYTAGVVLGIEHLHKKHIVYRNLKPRNVLLSSLGQPKLTDMSLAKQVVGHTFTTCGTPTYMAPEIISGVGHTRAVDWWSFGCLLFELMSGYSPFESELTMDIYSKVFQGIDHVQFPESFAGPVQDLIKSVLQHDAIDRLPMRPGGTKNVQNHAWFAGLDWDAMRSASLQAPYLPPEVQLDCKVTLPNFSTRQEPLPLPVKYKDDFSGWDDGFEEASSMEAAA